MESVNFVYTLIAILNHEIYNLYLPIIPQTHKKYFCHYGFQSGEGG